jgi:hypothetical protein
MLTSGVSNLTSLRPYCKTLYVEQTSDVLPADRIGIFNFQYCMNRIGFQNYHFFNQHVLHKPLLPVFSFYLQLTEKIQFHQEL